METVTFIKTPGKLHSSMLLNPVILSNTRTLPIKGMEEKKKIPKTALLGHKAVCSGNSLPTLLLHTA
jgi:hypothetical protein